MISAKPNATDTISSTLKVKFRNGMPLHWDGHGMSREEFYEFCVENHQLRIERNANGQLIIMPPTASETGHRTYVYTENADIQTVKFEEVLSGGEVCPGLEIVMGEVI